MTLSVTVCVGGGGLTTLSVTVCVCVWGGAHHSVSDCVCVWGGGGLYSVSDCVGGGGLTTLSVTVCVCGGAHHCVSDCVCVCVGGGFFLVLYRKLLSGWVFVVTGCAFISLVKGVLFIPPPPPHTHTHTHTRIHICMNAPPLHRPLPPHAEPCRQSVCMCMAPFLFVFFLIKGNNSNKMSPVLSSFQ